MPNMPIIIRAQSSIGGLVLVVDGYTDRQHKLASRIGGEPLETGRQVTDHVVATPDSIIFTGSVSDMRGGERTTNAFEEIKRLRDDAEPVIVVTEWHTYPEMVIARAEPRPVGRGMTVEIEMREILRVSSAGGPSVPATAQTGNAAGRSGEVARGRVVLGIDEQ